MKEFSSLLLLAGALQVTSTSSTYGSEMSLPGILRPVTAETVDTVWLVNQIDWTKIEKRGQAIEYRYTFGESTPGVQAIFKFGATLQSATSPIGDCSFSLVYGDDVCIFRYGEASTSGRLPFKITADTTVRIRIKPDSTADIWIDDLAILANQAVDLESNFISMIAKTDSPRIPKILHIASIQANLVSAR
ncbi:MAG: hypothetical protein EA353_07220 [Puniceicoccaceae bacterium]|nr:MAG: hypothetical protein EA353_07220 [Puniceicoccaceae bacterium]